MVFARRDCDVAVARRQNATVAPLPSATRLRDRLLPTEAGVGASSVIASVASAS